MRLANIFFCKSLLKVNVCTVPAALLTKALANTCEKDRRCLCVNFTHFVSPVILLGLFQISGASIYLAKPRRDSVAAATGSFKPIHHSFPLLFLSPNLLFYIRIILQFLFHKENWKLLQVKQC